MLVCSFFEVGSVAERCCNVLFVRYMNRIYCILVLYVEFRCVLCEYSDNSLCLHVSIVTFQLTIIFKCFLTEI